MNLKERVSLRYKIMTRITEYMYRDVIERHKRFIAELLVANGIAWESDGLPEAPFADSFYFEGRKYPENLGHYRDVLELHKTLVPRMVEHMSWYGPIMKDEFPLVETFIRKVLNYSDDIAFNIALFPSALHDCIRTIVNLDGITLSSKSIDEVAKVIGVRPKVTQAMTFRLMANLVGA